MSCGLRLWVCVFAGFLVLLPIGVSHLWWWWWCRECLKKFHTRGGGVDSMSDYGLKKGRKRDREEQRKK